MTVLRTSVIEKKEKKKEGKNQTLLASFNSFIPRLPGHIWNKAFKNEPSKTSGRQSEI